mgnify:CR=1 FL=1
MGYKAATPLPQPFTDSAGNALSGGTVEFYVTGTSTPATVYSDSIGTSIGTTVTLNSRGEPQNGAGTAVNIYYDDTVTYKVIRKTAAGTPVAPTLDPFTVFGSASTVRATGTSTDRSLADAALDVLCLKNCGLVANGFSAAFALAYSLNVGAVFLPGGDWTYSTGITIDREIKFYGAVGPGGGTIAERASGGAAGSPGNSTTRLIYTGTTGAAITIVGTGTEGLESVHLSDFSLWGNVTCDGGIKIGSGTSLRYCSFKNVHVRGFTNAGTDLGYGFYIGNIIDSYFENCFAQANNNGFNFRGVSTTLNFMKCTSRTNLGFGWLFQQCSDSVFYGCVGEGNNAGALQINSLNGGYVSSNDFYSFYCEANCNTISGPVVELRSTGTGVTRENNFHKITINEAVAGNVTRLIKFGTVDDNKFYGANLNTVTSGFAECSSSTTNCAILGRAAVFAAPSNVVNNGYDSNKTPRVLLGDVKPLTYAFTPAYVSGGAISGITDACYTRDCNKITIYFTFTVTDITGAANVLKFSGLPFVPAWRIYCGSTCSAVNTATVINTKTLIDTDSTFYLYFDNSYAGAGISVGCQFEYFI